MAHRTGRKRQKTRAKVLRGAGRVFRRQGFDGSTVDGLAQEASVTCGAFYAHFRSKADAFREAIAMGMDDLRRHIEHTRQQHGENWQAPFIDFYLGDRRTCELANSCTLQSLSSDVARADGDARRTYQASLRAIVGAMTTHSAPSPGSPSEQAISLLALLVGGVTFARAVHDPAMSDEIAAAIRNVALTFRTRYAAEEMRPPTGQAHEP
jgi:AcrR family transcriptional regulator